MDGTNPEGSAAPAPLSVADAVNLLMTPEAPEQGKQEGGEGNTAEAQEAEATGEGEGAQTQDTEAEESDTESEESEDEQPQTFTIKVDGKEESVTLDELISRAQMGTDYTRKTQEVAEQRKAAEAEYAAVRAAGQQHIQALTELTKVLSQPEPEPNWAELAQQHDPNQVLQLKFAYEAKAKDRAEAARLIATRRAEEIQRAAAEIPRLIPEWADKSVYEAERPAVLKFAESMGYMPQEIAQATDPRAFKVLRLAWKAAEAAKAADATQAQKTLAAKKVAQAPKMTKSNPAPSKTDIASKQVAADFARFTKAPSIDSGVEFLLRRQQRGAR